MKKSSKLHLVSILRVGATDMAAGRSRDPVSGSSFWPRPRACYFGDTFGATFVAAFLLLDFRCNNGARCHAHFNVG